MSRKKLARWDTGSIVANNSNAIVSFFFPPFFPKVFCITRRTTGKIISLIRKLTEEMQSWEWKRRRAEIISYIYIIGKIKKFNELLAKEFIYRTNAIYLKWLLLSYTQFIFIKHLTYFFFFFLVAVPFFSLLRSIRIFFRYSL